MAVTALVLLACEAVAKQTPAVDTKRFGAATRGGDGGRVIKVTNVYADGSGSLAEAIRQKGPRTIIFEAGGVIDLGRRTLAITEPYVTIAGQTAPSPGITIIRGSLRIASHDVIVKHISVRPGDAGEPKGSDWEPDGITTWGADAYNILIDHCSVTWAVDENLSASGPRHEGPAKTSRCVTFSNNLIAEALSRSTHSKGEHSKGTLIHDQCGNIAILGNIYAHNMDRNPRFKAAVTGVVVNNLIYDPGHTVMHFAAAASEWVGHEKPSDPLAAVVGNVLIPGPSTRAHALLSGGPAQVFVKDNIIEPNGAMSLTRGIITELSCPPVWPENLTAIPAESVYPKILSTAGARPAARDPIDARIIENIRTGRGRIIDSQDEVGGYPKHEMTKRSLTVPNEDIDTWLNEFTHEVENLKAAR